MKSILDSSFKYRNSSTHGDVKNFAKRQAARARIAKQQATPAAPNVVFHAWTPGRKTYEGKK